MSMSSTNRARHRLINQQHQELNTRIEALRSAIDRTRRDREGLEDAVQRLADLIYTHFDLEEREGYFTDAIKRAPHLSGRAEELSDQHRELAEQIAALDSLVRSGVESSAWWEQVERDAERFIDQMLEHEIAEKDLLQSAYCDDLGCGD